MSIASSLRLTIIGLTMVIALLLGLSAKSAWDDMRSADGVRQVTRIAAPLLDDLTTARLDRANTFRDLMGDKTANTPRTLELRAAQAAATDGALEALRAASFDGRDGLLADYEASVARLVAATTAADAAIAQPPKSEGRLATAKAWQTELGAHIAANGKLSASLSKLNHLADPVVDALFAVQSAALQARTAAGEASRIVSNSTSGVKLPDDAIEIYHGNAAVAAESIRAARALIGAVPMSPALAAAFDEVDKRNGEAFLKARDAQFAALLAGSALPLDTAGWLAISLPQLDAIAQVGVQALAQAEDHAAGQYDAAASRFYFSLATLAIGLVLAVGLIVAVNRGITGPLSVVTERTRRLAAGDLDTEAPYEDRRNEIGELGRALALFRRNAIEAESLRASQAEQQRAAAEARRRDMLALADQFDQAVGSAMSVVTAAAARLKSTAVELSQAASRTSEQTTAVAAASEQASANVASVAGATEELSSSVTEIGQRVRTSSSVAAAAVSQVVDTNERVAGLAEAAERVGSIVTMIDEIASRTNLLALNATIEAARAGEAGKGFAVVAAEVKQLADQTAKATSEISAQIGSMQSASLEAASAINAIGETIKQMNTISNEISSSVEGQGYATTEIARNVSEAHTGTAEVSRNIGGVTEATAAVSEASNGLLTAASDLSEQSAQLERQIAAFLSHVRAA